MNFYRSPHTRSTAMLPISPQPFALFARRFVFGPYPSPRPFRLKLLTVNAIMLTGFTGVLGGAIAVRAENPDHVRQLLETNECEGCDLSNSRLQGLNLAGANLQNSQLSGANLGNTDLTRANLQGANLSQAILTGAALQGTDLTGASLQGVTIDDSCGGVFGAMMTGAASDQSTCVALKLVQMLGPYEFCDPGLWPDEDLLPIAELCSNPNDFLSLSHSFFSQLFIAPNFQGANFSNADLTDVNLSTADLRYATLSGANLTNTNLDLAILMDAELENTQNGDFSQTIVSNQDIAEVLVPMFRQQAIAAYESEARTYTGAMNRAQQAHYIEKGTFSTTIADLQVGILEETDNYQYHIAQISTDLTIQSATPKRDDLSSYLGMVYIQPDENSGEPLSYATLCVSNLPATPMPTILSLASLQSDPATPTQISCPQGFYDYQTGESF